MGNTLSPSNDAPEAEEELAADISRLPAELTSKYEVMRKIGSGSFGSVYQVKDKKTGVVYAAKYVEVRDNIATEVSM